MGARCFDDSGYPRFMEPRNAQPGLSTGPLRLLSENLVAFPGLQRSTRLRCRELSAPRCVAVLRPQRRMRHSLRVSRLEIRRAGSCVDMPNEPPESNFKHKVKVTAYPAAERGGRDLDLYGTARS